MKFWLQAEEISSNVTYKFFANDKELSGADVRGALTPAGCLQEQNKTIYYALKVLPDKKKKKQQHHTQKNLFPDSFRFISRMFFSLAKQDGS